MEGPSGSYPPFVCQESVLYRRSRKGRGGWEELKTWGGVYLEGFGLSLSSQTNWGHFSHKLHIYLFLIPTLRLRLGAPS